MLRTSLARYVAPRASLLSGSVRLSSTAISSPQLRGIESRWPKMSEVDRQDLMSQLAERQKGPWTELTPLEKKAAWYVSYGEWGPRRPIYGPGDVAYIWRVTIFGIVIGCVAFVGIRMLAAPMPKTMSKEWQEKSDEILKENNANPFNGYSQVQSKPTGISEEDLEDDE